MGCQKGNLEVKMRVWYALLTSINRTLLLMISWKKHPFLKKLCYFEVFVFLIKCHKGALFRFSSTLFLVCRFCPVFSMCARHCTIFQQVCKTLNLKKPYHINWYLIFGYLFSIKIFVYNLKSLAPINFGKGNIMYWIKMVLQ